MNRLDEALINAHKDGNTSLINVFSHLAKNDRQNEKLYEYLCEKNLKTTTVRLPVDVIDALDALVSDDGMSLSRQDAISFAVSDFIGAATAGYVHGLVSSSEKSFQDVLNDFVDSLRCSDETKEFIKSRASNHLSEYLKND